MKAARPQLARHSRRIPTQSISKDAKRRTSASYAPPRTFNLAGLVGSRSIVYNGAVRGWLRVYEPKCRCDGRNVLSMRAHRSLHSIWMERLKRVPETNIESTGSLFQNET